MSNSKMENIVQKRKEKMVAVTGAGWPSQAKRSHAQHEEYARKTLYSYMPCQGLAGTNYVEAAVREYYGTFGKALADFVQDRNNCWCPKWVRRNYEIQNKEASSAVLPKDTSTTCVLPPLPEKDASDDPEKFPHASLYKKMNFVFDPAGEPSMPEDGERPEAYSADHHWSKENRELY